VTEIYSRDKHRLVKKILCNLLVTYSEKHAARPTIGCSSDQLFFEIALNGTYEFEELCLLKEFVIQNGYDRNVAVDIGANIGNHSVFFSDFFERVLSFEPSHFNFELLKLNTKHNDNIELYNFAIGATDCVGNLITNSSNYGGSSIKFNEEGPKGELVSVKKLKNAIGSGKVDLIKIDVEGMEYDVLKGAEEIIRKWKPIVVFEQSKNDIVNGHSDCGDYLLNKGYQLFQMKENYYLGSSKISRLIQLTLQSLFGKRLFLESNNVLRSKFHHMIIAVPED
jgi:FkbM family methyltransferase